MHSRVLSPNLLTLGLLLLRLVPDSCCLFLILRVLILVLVPLFPYLST